MKVQSPKSKVQSYFGFTLIEMLLVVSLLAISIAMVVELLFATLRANKKSQSLSEVKQNGDYAIKTMARMIRNAQSITSACPASTNTIGFINSDGMATTLVCDETAGYIYVNASSDKLTRQTGLTLSGCSFACSLGAGGSPDSVAIAFTLGKAAAGVVEEQVVMDFKTTISLRSY